MIIHILRKYTSLCRYKWAGYEDEFSIIKLAHVRINLIRRNESNANAKVWRLNDGQLTLSFYPTIVIFA